MGGGATGLRELVAGELFAAAPEAAARVAGEIRRRHGGALAAVVFYGSCLRRASSEGVLDFYALVDDYRSAYGSSRALALANRALPPNVFYLELESAPGPLRAKYAVLSQGDLARGVSPSSLRPSLWARFCQPARAVYTRDAAARDALTDAAAESIVTAVRRLAPLLPGEGDAQRLEPQAFWRRALRETYAAEMRTEPPESADALVAATPERYARALREGLRELERRGALRLRDGDALAPVWPPGTRRRARRAWRLRRPLAKAVYALTLLKSATTFGDWLPYALWKLERHTGTRLVPSERQRRHPLLWGWPLLFRALWQRDLR